ncbi:hypothetical protein ACFQ8W_00260 [Streptomyces sp. NPDC056508]|uniref:hypothetical protein n=1 Tax=Streptomyces sp. NPDC056508 TaxID=3345845 RepID=UPI0036B139CA
MSWIDVHTYNGDALDYSSDEPETVGDREVGNRSFRDGEELEAAEYIVGLLSERKHFDVRHTVN